MNKVLNRPMFRKEALRKGHLKPIKANVGQMVGMPTGGSQAYNPNRVPVVVNQPTGFQRMRPYMQRGIAALKPLGSMLSLPGYLGYEATGQVANAMGMQDSPYKTPLQVAGAYGATKLPGAAGLAKLGFGPQLLGAGAIGLGYLGYKDQQRFNALPEDQKRAERQAQEDLARSIESDGGISKGLFTRSRPKPVETETVKVRPQGRLRTFTPEEETKEPDMLLASNNTTDIKGQNLVDVDKLVKNDINNDPQVPLNPNLQNIVNQEKEKKKEKKLISNQKLSGIDTADKGIDDTGTFGDGKYSSEIITKAKQYQRELNEGRSSQAGLLFLANLASGLMTGTTQKGGIGGAIEVLGQALGPAANNYAIAKLKENEIENKLMGQALEIALAEYKLANNNVQTKGSLGRIQFMGPGGKIKNLDGGINENGIPYILVQGRQIPASDLSGAQLAEIYGDPSLNNFRYSQAIIKDKISPDEAKAHRLLLQNIKSKNIVYDVREIIEATGAAGTKGNLNIALSKLNSVMNDFGLGSTKDAIEKLGKNKTNFQNSLELGYRSGELSKDAYKKLKNAFDEDKIKKIITKAAEENYKVTDAKTGKLRKPTTQELFELVNAQTTLAYALANSFKDTDRLTQKDVSAAEAVINILPTFGGAETALASLNALEKDLDRSINGTLERLERTYFTSEAVLEGFLAGLKTGDRYGRGKSTLPPVELTADQRADILQGITF